MAPHTNTTAFPIHLRVCDVRLSTGMFRANIPSMFVYRYLRAGSPCTRLLVTVACGGRDSFYLLHIRCQYAETL